MQVGKRRSIVAGISGSLGPQFRNDGRTTREHDGRNDENADDPNDKMWLKLADAWLQMLPKNGPSASTDIPGWPKATDEDSKASH
jgi:hypothetical protein